MGVQVKTCDQCGRTFSRPKGRAHAQWEQMRRCSWECCHAAMRKERPLCGCGCGKRVRKPTSRWRAGHNPQDMRRKLFVLHTIREKARWYITAPGGGSTPWARVVMEREIGRPLRPAEVVHHRNGDSTDDRPENLQLFPNNREHMREEWRLGSVVGRHRHLLRDVQLTIFAETQRA